MNDEEHPCQIQFNSRFTAYYYFNLARFSGYILNAMVGLADSFILRYFFMGFFGVMAGIGGGVLFVLLVSGFFPFHIDFFQSLALFIVLGSHLQHLHIY